METIPVIGLPVAVVNYATAVEWILEKAEKRDRPYAVEAANTHVAALSRRDENFSEAMAKFDLIAPDGMPLLWTLNAHLPDKQKLRDRVYGPDLMLETLRATNSKTSSLKHFLLGGKQETLEKLHERFSEEFPESEIAASYSPPFGQWSEQETKGIIEKIRKSGASLVWVGVGCPKQELWIAKHKHLLPPAVYFGIGAAFPFHAGEVKQAPQLLQRLGLEWAYRLFREPRRLFKRYFTYNSLFLFHLIRDHARQ